MRKIHGFWTQGPQITWQVFESSSSLKPLCQWWENSDSQWHFNPNCWQRTNSSLRRSLSRMFCMCLSYLRIPLRSTVKLLSYINLFVFKTWAQGGRLALLDIVKDFTSLMTIPLVVVSLRLVYCLPILALLNMTLCWCIFNWVTQTLLIWNIFFSIYFLKLMSPLYRVMCVFEQNNIGFHFSPNHINPYNRLPLSIMTFEVLSKVTTLTGKQWFVTSSLMIMSILPRSTLLPINLRFPLFSKTYITPLKHNFIQKLQFFGVIMVENSKTITLVNS